MKRMNSVIGITAALLIGTFVTQATAYAQIGPDPQTNARHSRIVGLWDVVVTNTNCATGATLTAFPALHKFELGGTGQVVPSTNPTGLSAHMMIWSHVESNDYLMAIKMFRFDAVGTNIGWVVLNFEVSINEDADEYSGSGIAQVFDAAGNQVGGSCPSLVGTRFTGEP
jgi:hypothetical protein